MKKIKLSIYGVLLLTLTSGVLCADEQRKPVFDGIVKGCKQSVLMSEEEGEIGIAIATKKCFDCINGMVSGDLAYKLTEECIVSVLQHEADDK